uniref:Uncharacterized protein n=1 Tax=Anguilla anguilla TaxID=7936 RepID=A0A0E9PIH4_ANGAN
MSFFIRNARNPFQSNGRIECNVMCSCSLSGLEHMLMFISISQALRRFPSAGSASQEVFTLSVDLH